MLVAHAIDLIVVARCLYSRLCFWQREVGVPPGFRISRLARRITQGVDRITAARWWQSCSTRTAGQYERAHA